LFGTGVQTTIVTVSGTSLVSAGTTVTAGLDATNGSTELTSVDLLKGFTGIGTAATLNVPAGSYSSAGLSPLTAAALAPYFPASLDSAATISVTSVSNAEIKVNTPNASTVTGVTLANFAAPGNIGTISYTAPLETFNVTVTAGQAATTLASVSVIAAGGADYTDATGVKTTFVAPASDTTDGLTITANATDSSGSANGNPLLAPALTYSVSGVGLLNTLGAGNGVTYYTVPANTYTSTAQAILYSDGRAGKSTVTITANGVTVGTITVTYYGDVASITTVPLLTIGQAGAATGALSADTLGGTPTAINFGLSPKQGFAAAVTGNNPAIAVVLKDANGNVVPVDSNLTVTSSNPSVIYSEIPSDFIDNGLGSAAVGFGYIHTTFAAAYGAASGAKATLTYSYQNQDNGTIITSAPVSLSVGGAVAKETLTLDSASYTAGAPMTLTVTAVDASGNPVYDGAAVSTAGLTANKSIVGLPTSTATFVDGKWTSAANSLFAPATGGDFSIIGTGTDAAATPLSVTATVDDNAADAASLATDAANAATDAANAAAESADNATQAASDALAAVQSYVSKLFSGVKKEIAALLKLVHALKK
jgi:hypothetical protein